MVTIITATFNLIENHREKYFFECVDSVKKQTCKNIEHIIIDGGSNDGTLDLIKKSTDKKNIRYISEPDKGVYDAMNKGLSLARGEYITFLNSDDYYRTEKAVETSIDALKKTGAKYSFADTIGIEAETNRVVNRWKGNINLLPFGTHYCHQSMFIRTNFLKKMGGFDEAYKVSADSNMMTRLVAENVPYVYIPEYIVTYRSGGLSNNNILQTRKEHSMAFYKNIGKQNGLTAKDCYFLWNFSLIKEKNIFYCIKMTKKIKNEAWRKEYLTRLLTLGSLWYQIKLLIPRKFRRFIGRYYRTVKRRLK